MSTGAMQFTPWATSMGTDSFELAPYAASDTAAMGALSGHMGLIGIRINEEREDQAGQVSRARDRSHGESIHHIDPDSRDLLKPSDARRRSAVPLRYAPGSYDELFDRRIPGQAEEEAKPLQCGTLVEGKFGELLAQIFSEYPLRPVFCQFIQRQGDWGIGEGNFKALFESLELDRMRRGVREDGRRREISAYRQKA